MGRRLCAGFRVFSGSKHVGSFGDVSIFSTFSDKSFGSGEGGFIASNSDEIFDNIRLLRNQGRPSSGTFIHPSLGMNFRITDMQAALMYEQLSRWDEIRRQRQLTWIKWHSLLSSIRHIVPQQFNNLDESVPFRYAFTSLTFHKYPSFLKQIIFPSEVSFILCIYNPSLVIYLPQILLTGATLFIVVAFVYLFTIKLTMMTCNLYLPC